MTVSGLVLTLSEDPSDRGCALDALEADQRVVCGQAQGLRLPVVIETVSPEASEALCESLGRIPGVLFVDVVSIAFNALDDSNRSDREVE